LTICFRYVSNIWLTKFACNGRYLAAPTQEGKVFMWNLASGELTCVLKGHDREIRDIIFHPFAPYFVSSGEDTKVNIYKPLELVE
jgi:WD40 repeat protein